jgi:hypothetical protein
MTASGSPASPPLDPARGQLVRDGYCRVRGVLDGALLTQARALSAAALERTATPEHRAQWRSEGSLVPLSDHPGFSTLIAAPAIAGMLEDLGLADSRYSSGYVISKPPGGPALFWH